MSSHCFLSGETLIHSLFTKVYKWVSATCYYGRVHVAGEFPIQRVVGILLDTSCSRNRVKLRPCGLPSSRLYTPYLACVAIVTLVSYCHLTYLPSFQRRRLNVPACLLESIRKEEMVLPWKTNKKTKSIKGRTYKDSQQQVLVLQNNKGFVSVKERSSKVCSTENYLTSNDIISFIVVSTRSRLFTSIV